MKDKLEQIIANSYSPYSNYPVAAIVTMKDGKEFFGVNIENASYGATMCAERVAIFKAISAGYKKGDFAELLVKVKSEKLAFPCFLCRQVIVEFFDNDTKLVLVNDTKHEEYKMEEILTHPFTKEDLE